jgi:hypothetical protein
MTPDQITLVLLIAASIMTANHALTTWRNRSSAGASKLSTVYFTGMAIWQVYYFATLNQWYACIGMVLLAVAHAGWLFLLWRFRTRAASDLPFVRILP